MIRGLTTLLITMVLVATGAGPARAISPTAKCLTAKHKAAARKVKNKLTCDAKARSRGVPVDANCLARAEAKFAASFTKANARGVCPGTTSGVEAIVDSCVATLGADVPGDGRCQATTVKAEAKAGGCELLCAAKEVLSPGRLAACHPKCDRSLEGSLLIAGACGQSATIQADVHACRDNVVAAFSSTTTSTVTSTSISTTSTTSTTLGSPSGAFLDPR